VGMDVKTSRNVSRFFDRAEVLYQSLDWMTSSAL